MAKQPRLLFLCQTLPYPPDGGVNIRSYHLLRLLAAEYSVTALFFYRRTLRPTQKDVEASLEGLRELADADAFPIPQDQSRIRWYWDHLRSILRRKPYTAYMYATQTVTSRLGELMQRKKFDVVHVDSLDLAHYLRNFASLPVVCGHHNIESALLRRRANLQHSRLVNRYMRLQANLLQSQERYWCAKVALNITCSNADSELLRSISVGSSVMTVPNGVDTLEFPADYSGSDGLVFVGGYTWFPNRDGMEWFADSVLPIIRRRHPNLPVTWVGRMPDDVGRRMQAEHRISVTGYVDDIRPIVQRAACMIVPIRVGGGTRLKVLDGWSMGKAIVSTTIGCEGLDARNEHNMLVADSPEAFAEATLNLLANPALRERLGRTGRKTVENTYDWSVIQRQLLEAYRTVSSDARGLDA
jgi:glycosyltransferase involved in cell wall biosynthesis